jgi:hypothetical protein
MFFLVKQANRDKRVYRHGHFTATDRFGKKTGKYMPTHFSKSNDSGLWKRPVGNSVFGSSERTTVLITVGQIQYKSIDRDKPSPCIEGTWSLAITKTMNYISVGSGHDGNADTCSRLSQGAGGGHVAG